jgi:hypothetical protein
MFGYMESMWNLCITGKSDFETLKLRLISGPCVILTEIGLDATLTVGAYASTVGIAAILRQDHKGGVQQVLYLARNFIQLSVATPTLSMT